MNYLPRICLSYALRSRGEKFFAPTFFYKGYHKRLKEMKSKGGFVSTFHHREHGGEKEISHIKDVLP